MSTHADELFRTNSRAVATDLPPCRFRPKSGWDPLRFLLVQRWDLRVVGRVGMIFGVCHGEEYQVLR